MRPVDIIDASGGVFPPAGSAVFGVVPGRWVLYVAPSHPAYADVVTVMFMELTVEQINEFLSTPGLPECAAELARAEIARRPVEARGVH